MIQASAGSSVWADATLAAALFAIDPFGLGGVVLRAPYGAERDLWLEGLTTRLPPGAQTRRVPASIDDGALLGGLDLAASLAAGRPIARRGLLAEIDGGVAILPMAERLEAAGAARFAAVLDQGAVQVERDGLALRQPARIGLVLLDEGLGPEERPPSALLERLAFHLDFEGVGRGDAPGFGASACDVAAAHERLAEVEPPSQSIMEGLCEAASMLGIASLRAPLLALRAARANAALRGRSTVTDEDAAVAGRLVLAPRALCVPPAEASSDQPEDGRDSAAETAPSDETTDTSAAPPDADRVVDAVLAALPEDLAMRLDRDKTVRKAAARSGEGASAASARRGRPAGSRNRAPTPGARLNLVDTLRAAAPWQRLRGGMTAGGMAVQVRKTDFRFRRFIQRKPSTTIFVVDASGSTALQRLAEAKGAVELLLAKAYVSRARVALIGFRGTQADILLAPTRSLSRVKLQLAELPGGGGTPLATGIEAALAVAQGEVAKGQTPYLVFLTDGRANIGRTGAPGRAAAEDDALAASRMVAQAGVSAAYLDTSARPRPDGDRFALAMGAAYAPLPYANAEAVFGLLNELQEARA